MLTGKGGDKILTKEFSEDRRKALLDRTQFTDAELEYLEIEDWQGRGDTDPDIFIRYQYPFPVDTTAKKFDIREVKPEYGEMSDV